jgi:hypothetical protein
MASVAEEILAEEEAVVEADMRLATVRRERDTAKRLLRASEDRVRELEELMDRYSAIKPADAKVPKWLAPKKAKSKVHHATPVLMLSDLHLDEVVDLQEMDGMNEYNRDIAHKRMERIVEGAV